MPTYIVGDIQGCFTGLQRLLKKVEFSATNDRLIAVGDLIGRGSQPLETIEYLHSLGDKFASVLGNHDLHFLAICAGIRKAKPSDNLGNLLASAQLKTFTYWLRQKPLALMADQNTLVTHAGLYPKWSVQKALKVSAEVSQQLQSKNWKDMLAQMYGNQPVVWKKSLRGSPRLRFTVNALTRMRFIKDGQELDFSCKMSPQQAPDELVPWFKVTNLKLKPEQKVVFGHWASLNGRTGLQQFRGLDTGYIWGQEMTLLNLCSGKVVSIKHQD